MTDLIDGVFGGFNGVNGATIPCTSPREFPCNEVWEDFVDMLSGVGLLLNVVLDLCLVEV